jgi:hypothetical protein
MILVVRRDFGPSWATLIRFVDSNRSMAAANILADALAALASGCSANFAGA